MPSSEEGDGEIFLASCDLRHRRMAVARVNCGNEPPACVTGRPCVAVILSAVVEPQVSVAFYWRLEEHIASGVCPVAYGVARAFLCFKLSRLLQLFA
jgi:hypothetical protein